MQLETKWEENIETFEIFGRAPPYVLPRLLRALLASSCLLLQLTARVHPPTLLLQGSSMLVLLCKATTASGPSAAFPQLHPWHLLLRAS